VACNTGGTIAHVWIHADEFGVAHLMVKIAGTTSEVSLGTSSGAADGSGNFLFDYLEDPTGISIGAFASFP
jgi:hypothetical protein